MNVKVFLSWSGKKSLRVADVLKEWLKSLIPDIDIFISTESIDKGNRWGKDISEALEQCTFGIFCLTKENLNAPWLNFEAGALFRSKSKILPFLFDLGMKEIQDSPLALFQTTTLDKLEIEKMVKTLSKESALKDLGEDRTKIIFDALWPNLKNGLTDILADASPMKKDRISEYLRLHTRTSRDTFLGSPKKRVLAAKYEVWVSGTTLNLAGGDAWRGFEATNAKFTTLLPDFNNKSVIWGTSVSDNTHIKRQKSYMELSADVLSTTRTNGGIIDVYLLPYVPAYSFFAIDPLREYDSDGYISIEIQGYHFTPSDTPNFTLFKNNPNHSDFYDYYIGIWKKMIENSTKYVCEVQENE